MSSGDDSETAEWEREQMLRGTQSSRRQKCHPTTTTSTPSAFRGTSSSSAHLSQDSGLTSASEYANHRQSAIRVDQEAVRRRETETNAINIDATTVKRNIQQNIDKAEESIKSIKRSIEETRTEITRSDKRIDDLKKHIEKLESTFIEDQKQLQMSVNNNISRDGDQVVRIYGHGLHDFCKEGHDRHYMQAKYAFPNVHFIVGLINHKVIEAHTRDKLLYNDLERQESILHCRHVDEVLCDVPWSIDQDFLDKHKIDYVTITDQHKEHLFTSNDEQDYDSIQQKGSKFIKILKSDGRYLELKHNFISADSIPQSLSSNLDGKIAAFSDDLTAIETRDKCTYDFKNRITLESAKNMQQERPIRIYADGIYDMFHPGHARQLKQAKEAFPYVHLMVGVVNDELTNRYKGPTVVPEAWRYDRVRHCRYVDEVVKDAPWVIDQEFLIRNKIDFVAHDDLPYKFEGQEDVYKPVKELGMFLATKRMEGISTTDLKIRLKKHSC